MAGLECPNPPQKYSQFFGTLIGFPIILIGFPIIRRIRGLLSRPEIHCHPVRTKFQNALYLGRCGSVKQMRGYVKRMLTTFQKLSTLRGGLRPNSVFALVPYRSGRNPTDGGTRLKSRASGGMLTTFQKLSTLRGGLRLNSVFALVPYRSGWNPTDGGTRLESRASRLKKVFQIIIPNCYQSG